MSSTEVRNEVETNRNESQLSSSCSSFSDTMDTDPLRKIPSKECLNTVTAKVEEPFTCKLCFDDFFHQTDVFSISSCGCRFCKQCMQSYVEVLIRDGVVLSITCPDAECSKAGAISSDEIQQLAQQETFEKYNRLKFEQEVAIDPHRTFCPQVACSTVCHVCSNSSNHDVLPDPFSVSCPTCKLQFCYICKAEWKTGHACNNFSHNLGSEFQRLQARAGLKLSDEMDAMIKRCPVCTILIEKDRGCAQMICKNCSHVFCWYCLKLLDNDFLLRHYDKGPCRNMLGHSRAQVFRHRIGVVGLFAAFSLLLVVASPVLLLAAPIVLCCKCKECCQQAINQANQHRDSVEIARRTDQQENFNRSDHRLEEVTINLGSSSKPQLTQTEEKSSNQSAV
ncbi:putative E3 ubiquitin-protein ligase RNF144A [Clavelina lepadiformis]|uniref:putative E3 ubiquitin-protein ligase RNF144A n=1 Tax=Clavelina lepadiformis TaxID=159417 RepID=UPI004042438F